MKLDFENRRLGTRMGMTLGCLAILAELVVAAGGDAQGDVSGLITMYGFKVGISIVGWWVAAWCVGHAADWTVSGVRERRFDFSLVFRIAINLAAIAAVVCVRVALHPVAGRAISDTATSVDAYNGRKFDDAATITLKAYVDSLREAAAQVPTEGERELFPNGPGLVPSETTHYIQREFQVIYIDERYVSFRADMTDYHGGNGNHSQVFVGTIERKSGRVLGVVDFVPKSKLAVLRQKLYDAAIKKIGGKDNLQGEVEVIENFCYTKDGLHFVYNPYEIACGATGAVEVVIDPRTL